MFVPQVASLRDCRTNQELFMDDPEGDFPIVVAVGLVHPVGPSDIRLTDAAGGQFFPVRLRLLFVVAGLTNALDIAFVAHDILFV